MKIFRNADDGAGIGGGDVSSVEVSSTEVPAPPSSEPAPSDSDPEVLKFMQEIGFEETPTVVIPEEPKVSEEVPPVDPIPSELEILKKQNAELIAKLNEIAESTLPTETPKTEEEPKAAPVDTAKQESFDLWGGEDHIDVLNDKAKCEAMLGKFGNLIFNTVMTQIATKIPTVVTQQIEQQNAVREMATDFYSAHPDLATIKPVVSFIMKEVMTKNTGLPMGEVLKQTAEKAKALVATMPALQEAQKKSANTAVPPATPKSGSTRQASPEMSEQQKHMLQVMGLVV